VPCFFDLLYSSCSVLRLTIGPGLTGILVCLLSLYPASDLQAQTRPSYDIPRVDSAPVIDGRLDDAEWETATRVAINIETEPGENIPAKVDTQALLLEDGEVLYVAFIARDEEPEQIRAFYRDRDLLWDDDWVGIVLDTFNDERRAYEFYVNPLGVQADDIWDDVNERADEAWNAIWDSAGEISAEGYTVEMAIPLKQLRFNPNSSLQTWGIQLVRYYPRDRENRFSNSVVDRNIACYLCQLNKARGFADLEPSMNLEVIPSLTTSYIENRQPALGEWVSEATDPQAGLDIRWGITQDTYLNATINPDFSQVEADNPQLDINNTFNLFFPERRTFFLDGADYFDTSQNLVYTRNIADPDYGAKLTGKSGVHQYGLLLANDEVTSFIMPGSLRSSIATLPDTASDVSIGRYRLDIFSNSTVGALITDRRGDDYSNTVISIDATLRPTNQDTVTIQSMRSSTRYPLLIQESFDQPGSLGDSFNFVEYRRNTRHWDVWAAYTDVGSDFRADLGFINRVDYSYFVSRVGHTWWGDGEDFFNRGRVALDYDTTSDQSGLKLEEEVEVFVNLNGPLQSYFNGLFGGSETFWNGEYFDEWFANLSLGFAPTRSLRTGITYRVEDVVDFANTRLGHSTRYTPFVNYQWGRHLQFNLDHTLQLFDVDGGRLFTANLTDLRTTYQFSARSFLRYTLQYDDRERNQGLYLFPVESRSKQLTTQLLYSYRVNAATRFFVGYSDAGFQDDSQESIYRTNRSFFAKFTYAWQP